MRMTLRSAGSILLVLGMFATPGVAQRQGAPGCMGMGGGNGMMMMGRDSATRAQMRDVHELVMRHEDIARRVTNLPDGVRTLTESDDPALALIIRRHVREMAARVATREDMGLPMESPALRTLFRNGDRIRTVIEPTPKGAALVQTADDAETVAALQRHAAEVTDLVTRGRVAMHEAMAARCRGG
jgi:hypothetical protein